jgi:putative DNA primase/helicase
METLEVPIGIVAIVDESPVQDTESIEELFEPAWKAENYGNTPDCSPSEAKREYPYVQFSDAGNGARLVAEYGDFVRYVNDERGWRIYDGVRWTADKTGEITRLALKTIRGIMVRAAETDKLELREKLAKWSLSCESRSRLENMVALASREQKVSTNSVSFDVSPWLLNCANGTIDLEAKTFRPARREDLLSKRSPVAYDPNARCPRFDAFLAEILPSEEIRRFLQTSLGYTLCGHAWEKYVWFLIGGGDNGKTVLIETIRYVFGEDDYATNMNFNSLLHREGQGPSGDIARLRGARFVSACESDQGQKISPALLKRLSGGGDKITASYKYRDEFEFVPTHKLWLATNHAPQLAAEDDALWRRIARVPFNVRIPLEQQDERLQEKLKAEGPGILNWLFDGWKTYLDGGLKLPAEVQEETDRYRDASDVVKDFLQDCVVPGSGDIGSTRLYQAYKGWFADTHNQRQQPMSQKMFSMRLEQLGHPIEKKRDGNVFSGIGRLVGDEPPTSDGLFE